MSMEKDKKRITIEDVLQSYHDGITAQKITDKTGLVKNAVLARLNQLIREKKVQIKQINGNKQYLWNKSMKVKTKISPNNIKHKIQVTPLKEHHIKKGVKVKNQIHQIDMASLKKEIEETLKKGGLSKSQAEIKMQRAPLAHITKDEKHLKDVRVDKFIKTGIPGFDELFERGIPKGNSVIVAGGAGSGKTIFCLQTLFKHASDGEKCLYMSFEESEERLMHHMEDFGWDPHPLIKKGHLLIKRFNPFDITRSVDALLMKAKGELLIDVEPIIFPEGFRPDIIVLDSLTAIASAFTGKEDSYRVYIEQLFRFFEQVNATSLLITETEQVPKMFSSTGVEEFLSDGVIVLYAIKNGNIRENAIEVLKMRGEKHQKKIVALQISDKGITVFPEQEVFGGTGE